jgi:hypothetical protein
MIAPFLVLQMQHFCKKVTKLKIKVAAKTDTMQLKSTILNRSSGMASTLHGSLVSGSTNETSGIHSAQQM